MKDKRILFIYRGFAPGTQGAKATDYIIDSLKEKYDAATYANLDERVVEVISSAPPDKRFSAVVTHVPYTASSGRVSYGVSRFLRERIEVTESYQDSLLILRRIKMAVDIPIIAYTGAGDSSTIISVFWEGGGVDQVISKTTDLQKDSKDIIDALGTLIPKYEKLPPAIPEPILKKEGSYTTVEVKVNLNGGVGLAAAAAIAKESNSYTGKVLLKKLDDEKDMETYDAKTMLAFLGALIREDERINILVEGADENARGLAKRLYFAFSSRYSFTMDLTK